MPLNVTLVTLHHQLRINEKHEQTIKAGLGIADPSADEFHRLEAAGRTVIIDGLGEILKDDRKLLQQTSIVFDGLYSLLSKQSE